MAALESGAQAPDFTLSDMDGVRHRRSDLNQQGLLFTAFYKVGCGTCKFTAPYLEKFFQAYNGKEGFQFYGVSQDSAEDTAAFMEEHGATFPNLLDETHWASADHGLTNVPTLFLTDRDGKILESCVGFSRSDLNSMSRKVADHLGVETVVVSERDDGAPEMKPG